MPNRPPSKASKRKPWTRKGGKTSDRGYGWDWQKVRDAFIRANPVCVDPFAFHPNVVTPAEHVDHIIPFSRGGERLDASNLQSLCAPCHRHKTAIESNQ